MNRIAYACLALAGMMAPAEAATLPSGEVIISQAAVNAGNITPGDTPGFPVTISVPGSYGLTSNLTVTTAANGIEVRANEVTIDLGGFTLAGSGAGRNGVTSFNRGTRVIGGTVRGFTLDGIRTIAQYLEVTDTIVTAHGRYGISAFVNDPLDTAYARISNSTVTKNVTDGIRCARFCRVENTVVAENSGNGIVFEGRNGTAFGNSVLENLLVGIVYANNTGSGNNTIASNGGGSNSGNYQLMQPNACDPACPPSQPF